MLRSEARAVATSYMWPFKLKVVKTTEKLELTPYLYSCVLDAH